MNGSTIVPSLQSALQKYKLANERLISTIKQIMEQSQTPDLVLFYI